MALHPSKPCAFLLQEMASRWCHQYVCLFLTIEVYDDDDDNECSINNYSSILPIFIYNWLQHPSYSSTSKFEAAFQARMYMCIVVVVVVVRDHVRVHLFVWLAH